MTNIGTRAAIHALDEGLLQSVRNRRSSGGSLGSLARECGLSWQKLWGYLHNSPPPANQPVVRPAGGTASLVEKYRPTSLDTLWGQEAVVKILRSFAANPHPAAFLFEGDTGTGKTSAALVQLGDADFKVALDRAENAEFAAVFRSAGRR